MIASLRMVRAAALASMCVVFAAGVRGAAAQDAAVDAALVRLARYCESIETLDARFEQAHWQRVLRRSTSSRGRVRIQRPGRVRFDYDPPAARVFVADGDGWLMYEPIEGGAGQFTRGAGGAAAAIAFGALTGSLDVSRHSVSLRAPLATDPPHTEALELRPRESSAPYRRVVLYMRSEGGATTGIVRVAVEDPDGNWNRFDLSGLTLNRGVGADAFRFSPPPGARELRAR